MVRIHQDEGDYFRNGSGSAIADGDKAGSSSSRDEKLTLDQALSINYSNTTGQIYDPYGGKKLGMVRVRGILPLASWFEADVYSSSRGPNPAASLNEPFTSVLNVAFAYAGNQAFTTVMFEMPNPSKDYTPAIIWLNVFGIPMYVITACGVYNFAGQYVVSLALGSAPGAAAKVAYGILFPTLLGSELIFGHTVIKYMYNVFMDNIIETEHKLTDDTFLTWGVWLTLGTAFWITAFILANAIPVFNSILSISSALFVTWITFGMANAQWIFLNWGQQFSTWRKSLLAILNWLFILGTLTAAPNYRDPTNPLDGPFTCADNSLF